MADDRHADILRAEAAAGPAGPGESEPAEDPAEARNDWSAWSNLWQVPAIVLSVGLIALGLWLGVERPPVATVQDLLDSVDELIVRGRLDEAKEALRQRVEPRLAESEPPEEARYHATVADWITAVQLQAGARTIANDRAIDGAYARAREMGLAMSAPRLEAWGLALVNLGRAEEARLRIQDLEVLSVIEEIGPDARTRRNRLVRCLVERDLARGDLDEAAVMSLLEEFRRDPLLAAGDVAWAIARQAELRIEAGRATEAVDRLLPELRRLEENVDALPAEAWGEFYTLLGRGYVEQGRYDQARYVLEEALARLDSTTAVRGEAILLQARIDIAGADFEAARDRLDAVVHDYVGTPALLPARLLRAEARSILGDHEGSLEDYRAVLAALPTAPPRRDLTADIVASSLADRHDAALLIGELPLAMRYVSLAESIFPESAVPTPVLQRIAMTSRQTADDIMDGALADLARTGRPALVEAVDPAERHRAGEHYERAGRYFLRHARAVAGEPEADESWARSLWLAGDSYDLAGHRDRAVELMTEYIEGRPASDPLRPEVTFRLAQAQEACRDFAAAAATYERLLAEHPRSTQGTRAHVSLARCLMALDRWPEAESRLREVLAGQSSIDPEAPDYRAALLELGNLYYRSEEYSKAVVRLDEALERYGAEAEMQTARFQLADSLRRLARQRRREAEQSATMPPRERAALAAAAERDLERALALFEEVTAAYAARADEYLDVRERDEHRFASLYRGDCAYELGDRERAVRFYDDTARAFADHHSSLIALIQIVNCYEELGDARRADIAHRKAVTRLGQLPPDAFDDPAAIMDRAAWERWLARRPFGLARAGEGELN